MKLAHYKAKDERTKPVEYVIILDPDPESNEELEEHQMDGYLYAGMAEVDDDYGMFPLETPLFPSH